MKKYYVILASIFLMGAVTSPNRFYELILTSGNFWVDTTGNADFQGKVDVADLQIGSYDFDMSTLDDGELLGRSGTDIIGISANSFLGLTDTPESFVADKVLAVNGAGTAVEFVDSAIFDTESELESALTDVTDVLTNNDEFTDVPGVPAYSDGEYLKSTASGVVWDTPAGAGTVTSVALSGTDGIQVDSGSPVTTNGTIQLGIDAATLLLHLDVEAGAENLSGTDIETLYNSQVALASQAQAEAGSSTEVLRWTPQLISYAISALAPTSAGIFEDDGFTLQNNADNTKELIFDLSGITTSTERTWTVPDSDIDFGNLTDSLISNTLTSSLFVGSGSTTTAIDLATAEAAGQLPNSKLASMAAATMKGRAKGAGSGAPQDLNSLQIREIASNSTAITSTSAELNWNGDNYSKVYHTMTEDTEVQDNSGTPEDLQMILFVFTQSATARTLTWDAVFVNPDGAMPALLTGIGDISMYGFTYFSGRTEYVLCFHKEYDVS